MNTKRLVKICFLTLVIIIASFLSGCVDTNTQEVSIKSNGLDMTLDNYEGKPLKIMLLGNGNTIHVSKNVSIAKIDFMPFTNNNTIYLCGGLNETTGFNWYTLHNCTINNGGDHNTVLYHNEV